ncbi:MAG: class I SAM-dependent methyltransferase [Chloroflexia bacterium]
MESKRIVAEGYDAIAETYRDWATRAHDEARSNYTKWLLDHVPAGEPVLDLGCGSGVPTTLALAARFRVTGVDISGRHIALARAAVPGATFIQADMTALDLPDDGFAAVAAFYSLIHVPRSEQPALLAAIAQWLRPGGSLVATMGARPTEAGYEADWLGAPMYWSSWDSATNRRLVTDAGFELVSAQEETAEEHGGPVTFLWVIARKPSGWA